MSCKSSVEPSAVQLLQLFCHTWAATHKIDAPTYYLAEVADVLTSALAVLTRRSLFNPRDFILRGWDSLGLF